MLYIAIALAAIGDAKQVVRLPGGTRTVLASAQLPAFLHLGNRRERFIQTLVLDDFGSVHRAQFVKCPVGQGRAALHDLEAAVGIVADDHLLAR